MTVSHTSSPASRRGRWVAWLILLLVVVIVAGTAVLSGRPWMAVAAVLGAVTAWLVTRIRPAARRHPVITILALLALVLLGTVGLGSIYFLQHDLNLSPAPAPRVSVRYQGTGQLTGATVALREEIVVDREALDAIDRILGRG